MQNLANLRCKTRAQCWCLTVSTIQWVHLLRGSRLIINQQEKHRENSMLCFSNCVDLFIQHSDHIFCVLLQGPRGPPVSAPFIINRTQRSRPWSFLIIAIWWWSWDFTSCFCIVTFTASNYFFGLYSKLLTLSLKVNIFFWFCKIDKIDTSKTVSIWTWHSLSRVSSFFPCPPFNRSILLSWTNSPHRSFVL